jgi:intracellular septation protein
LKFLFDFFPLILFFVAYQLADIYWATGVAMAATVAQIGYVLARGRKVSGMQWASLAIIGLFGGATLILRDEMFIKWKPTVLYWLAGVGFIGALAFGRNPVRAVIREAEPSIDVPAAVWTRLCIAWGVFFLFKGALNLWVAYTFSTPVWVKFKVFGSMGLMLAFVIAQAMWLSKYLPDEPPKGTAPAADPPPGPGP